MSGERQAVSGGSSSLAVAVAEALRETRRDVTVHEEMRRIRVWRAQGLAGAAELRRYRSLWVTLSLRRSTCSRDAVRSDVGAALARVLRARERLHAELARAAVDAAFGPEDGATKEDAAQPY